MVAFDVSSECDGNVLMWKAIKRQSIDEEVIITAQVLRGKKRTTKGVEECWSKPYIFERCHESRDKFRDDHTTSPELPGWGIWTSALPGK